MLFVLPNFIHQGIGKRLLLEAINIYKVNEVTVNEENPDALRFYFRFGFKIYKRTDLDEEGNTYPLLYLKR